MGTFTCDPCPNSSRLSAAVIPGSAFAEHHARHHAQEHPHRQVPLKERQTSFAGGRLSLRQSYLIENPKQRRSYAAQ